MALSPTDDYPLFVWHGARSTSWAGPYATADEARAARDRIATVGDSLGIREPGYIGRARYVADPLVGIEFAPVSRATVRAAR